MGTSSLQPGLGKRGQGFTGALTGNAIRGNSIFSNGGIGIDLGGDGVTANDALDADNGPNQRQNYPIVVSAAPTAPSGTNVTGTLDSAASTAYILDFYANPPCEGRPQDFSEGLLYLGSDNVVTDGSGHAAFDTDLTFTIEVGQPVTVTATDPNGHTSELSPRIVFSISPVSGDPAGGGLVAILGTDFDAGATVTIGGQPATDVIVVNSTQISARTPALPAARSNVVGQPRRNRGRSRAAQSRTSRLPRQYFTRSQDPRQERNHGGIGEETTARQPTCATVRLLLKEDSNRYGRPLHGVFAVCPALAFATGSGAGARITGGCGGAILPTNPSARPDGRFSHEA